MINSFKYLRIKMYVLQEKNFNFNFLLNYSISTKFELEICIKNNHAFLNVDDFWFLVTEVRICIYVYN